MAHCIGCGAALAADRHLCEECAGVDNSSLVAEGLPKDERRAFMQFTVEYLQRRLEFVNKKANIFIAIQTGLFVTITWLLGEYFLSPGGTSLRVGTTAFLVGNFAFIVAIVGLLLQTVRPSRRYLSLFTGVDTLETANVMWPGNDVPTDSVFTARMAQLDSDTIHRELVGTIYVLQQLVDRTYRWAVRLMKLQILLVPLGFLLLIVVKYH